MVINHNDNINIRDDKNSNIKNNKIKYCWKCGRELEEGSVDHFCDFYCRQEYHAENRRENDALYREWASID
jgi:hypothetical protein